MAIEIDDSDPAYLYHLGLAYYTSENFIDAEKRTIKQLKETKKPFVLVLNSANPTQEQTIKLKNNLKKEYEVPVVSMNVNVLKKEDVDNINISLKYLFNRYDYSNFTLAKDGDRKSTV